ncbi:unnamed protein product, partial [Rotaria sp. Silwood2]
LNENIVENNNSSFIHIVADNNDQASDINNEQATNIIIETSDSIDQQQNNFESIEDTSDVSCNISNTSSTPQIQHLIIQYFSSEGNSFQAIEALNENFLNFRIRSKIIYKSPIRFFGTSGKVFDAIVCDFTGEIKIVAFNEDVDRLYNNMIVHQVINKNEV